MTTVGLMSPFVTDTDLAVSAILEASHPLQVTPPQKSRETQNVITFTSSGLTTPARLHQNLMDPTTASMPHQLSPFAASTPRDLIVSSAARPPLPHHAVPFCDTHHMSGSDSLSPFSAQLKPEASVTVSSHSVDAHSASKMRPRKLSL